MAEVLVSSVLGNGQKLDGGAMYGNAPKMIWEKWSPPDSFNRINLACRSLLIELDDIKILCETGIGNYMNPKMAERFGIQNSDRHILLESLAKLNVSPEQIDYVILSHLHFDHAGGLLASFNEKRPDHVELLFTNAHYITSHEAFARAENPHVRDKASFIPGLTQALKNSGRLILNSQLQMDDFFSDHLEFAFSKGHTPGHMHTLVKGNDSSLFFAGDLIPATPWVHLPITMGYDRFPEHLINEKADTLADLSQNQRYCFFTHDPLIACSKITLSESKKYEVMSPMHSIERMAL